MIEDIFNGHGVEVLIDDTDGFLKIKETLTRMGVLSRKNMTLYPSCYLLHRRGRYIICHFKELFALDGKQTDISENDLARRNTIARLLEEWGLLSIVDKSLIENNYVPVPEIKILSHKEKSDFTITHKYSIGRKDPK